MAKKLSSSGHRLGQLIGDWWEEYVVCPLLEQVADELDLYLDNRFKERSCRGGEKIVWQDDVGNEEAFSRHGLVMDYPDRTPEAAKAKVARNFEKSLASEIKKEMEILARKKKNLEALS